LATGFLPDLGLAVASALVFSLLFYKLRLPMIVGQLVAGMVVGPFGLGLIRDTTAIDFLASKVGASIRVVNVVPLRLGPRSVNQFRIRERISALSFNKRSFRIAVAAG
jgi:predicted Kef-type K+ transport protein